MGITAERVDLSDNKFKRKGFKGHKVNEPNYRIKLPTKDPSLTNHERMLQRRSIPKEKTEL